ncbi:MAG: hypothetical protein ACTSX6_00310 [Candidatus Heimdallarchaeaceae archaeon]
MTEPLKIGYNIKIKDKYYRVSFVENIGEVYKDVSVGASGETDYTTFDELYVPENQLGHYFVGVEHNVWVYTKVGVKDRFGTERALGILNMDNSPPGNEKDINLYVIYNLTPKFKIVNQEPVAITARLKFTGYRYTLEELAEVPETYTEIPISPP